MKKILFIFSLGLVVISCGDNPEEQKNEISNEKLIETIDGIYYEYYPGKKQIKITGPVLEDGTRNGRWELYGTNGRELGFTMYEKGIRQGHSYTSYPDGRPHYHGEYWADTLIGVWKTYTEDGQVIEKDYGLPEGY